MGAWENEFQISQEKTQVKFQRYDFILVHFAKLKIFFLGPPNEIFFGVITDN